MLSPTSPIPRFSLGRADAPSFISFGPVGLWLPESSSGSPEEVAFAFFQRHPRLFGTAEARRQLRLRSVEEDSAAPHMTHVTCNRCTATFRCSVLS